MTHVSLQHLSKAYPGASTPALDRLSMEISTGELTALLGPSGCGKTTTLKMIAGLLDPTSGDITFDGHSVLKDKPEQRGVVMVFQNNLLFPYMSVAENVGFGLKMRGIDKTQIKRRVGEMLDLVKLPDLGARKPSALSGGQQQRVALARALIVQPNVLLLDEPLSNLDAHLRFEMRDLIRSLQQELGITTIFVTHDQEEAVVLADKVALILNGRMTQYDRAEMFYRRPVDEATARFFGGRNFVAGASDGTRFTCALGAIRLPVGAKIGQGKLTFRPENVRIGAASENSLRATIQEMTYLGTQTRLKLRIGDTVIEAISNPIDIEGRGAGDNLEVHLPSSTLWVID